LAWAKSIPNEADRVLAEVAALPGWARLHPEGFDISFLPADKQLAVIHEVTSEWAVRNPATAMDYALSLDNPKWRKSTAIDVVRAWVIKDPAAVIQWANALPAGELRDASLQTIGYNIAPVDLAKAENLVSGIQDNALRQSTMESLVSRSLRSNPQQALQLADKLPQVGYSTMVQLVENASTPEINAAVRTWVEQAQAAGKIKYPTYHGPAGTDPAEVKQWEQTNAAKGYQAILQSLTQAAQRKP
jgi:hypothetical protein